VRQAGDGGEHLAPILASDGCRFGRPDRRVVWRAMQPGDPPRTVHAAAAVDYRRPQVGHRVAEIVKPRPPPPQAEEGVVNHILGGGLVAREQQREADHADRVRTIKLVDTAGRRLDPPSLENHAPIDDRAAQMLSPR
jgi:hypothetical protein